MKVEAIKKVFPISLHERHAESLIRKHHGSLHREKVWHDSQTVYTYSGTVESDGLVRLFVHSYSDCGWIVSSGRCFEASGYHLEDAEFHRLLEQRKMELAIESIQEEEEAKWKARVKARCIEMFGESTFEEK